MHTTHSAIVLLLVAAIGGCSGELSSPSELSERPLFDEGGTDCDIIIYDDGTCDYAGGGAGYDTYYYETLDGSASADYDLGYGGAAPYANGAQAICPPGFLRYGVPATVNDPEDPQLRPLSFVSSGVWEFIMSQIYPFPWTQYRWPSGFWDAVDGSGRSISVGTADATCSGFVSPDGRWGIRVNFYAFHDVEIRRPRGGQQQTGGGGDTGGGTCHDEWLVLEINYGDGTGWHELWEGWGQVCE